MAFSDTIKTALANPEVEAELVVGFTTAVTKIADYLSSLPDADRQHAIDRLKASGMSQTAKVLQFDTDVVSDEAAASAEIDVIEANKKAAQ